MSDLRTFCPECGPNVYIDEDGCCTECGALATGEWVTRISVRSEAAEVSDCGFLPCRVCGRLVATCSWGCGRPGHDRGVELSPVSGGGWVCSESCWEGVVGPAPGAVSDRDPARELAEEITCQMLEAEQSGWGEGAPPSRDTLLASWEARIRAFLAERDEETQDLLDTAASYLQRRKIDGTITKKERKLLERMRS